jgi:hypothetical protein
MKRLILLAGLMIVFSPFLANACDTNLIALISGKSATNEFAEKVSRLVAISVELGKNIETVEMAKLVISKLMNSWINFDNGFSNYPPDWAKKDKNWNTKFKNLADMIGEINASMRKNNLSDAHNKVLEFSKRITILFEYMPKSEIGEKLYEISINLMNMNDLFKAKDASGYSQGIDKLAQDFSALQKLLEEPLKKHTEQFAVYLGQLRQIFDEQKGKLDFKVKMTMMLIEDTYVEMNEKLSMNMSEEQTGSDEENDKE